MTFLFVYGNLYDNRIVIGKLKSRMMNPKYGQLSICYINTPSKNIFSLYNLLTFTFYQFVIWCSISHERFFPGIGFEFLGFAPNFEFVVTSFIGVSMDYV